MFVQHCAVLLCTPLPPQLCQQARLPQQAMANRRRRASPRGSGEALRLVVMTKCEKGSSAGGDDPVTRSSPPDLVPDPLQNWSTIGIALLSLGFCIGPLLDGVHSNVQLQIYKNGAIAIGPLQSNVVVPPLLGIFYGGVGLSQLALDKWLAPKDRLPRTSLKRLLFSLIFLISILELSAEMYKAGTPYNMEAYVLFALAELNWVLFDGTWWGFGLASIVGVLCPLSEIPFMKFFNVWHYPKANVEIFGEGLVTWVLACYFSYVPFLANLSRWLSSQINSQESDQFSD